MSREAQLVVMMTYNASKLCQNNLVLVCDQSLLLGLCMQNDKCPPIAVIICTTLVNTQTHRQTAFDHHWPS